MTLKQKYISIFGEMPPLLMTMDYDNMVYQNLMQEAILKRKPIRVHDIENFITKNKIDYDVVQ